MLSKSFPELLDPSFTAAMELKLDQVEEGKSDWQTMIRDFYGPFQDKVTSVQETLESVKGVMDEKTDVVCDVCGRPMVKKLGRYGFFLACTGFPECKNTKPVPAGHLPAARTAAARSWRASASGDRGREFYGCTNYPTCDFVTYFKPTDSPCPKCGLVPGGEGGPAARHVQVLHQPGVRLPAYQGGGLTRVRRYTRMRRPMRDAYLVYLGSVRHLSPHTAGVLRQGPGEVRGRTSASHGHRAGARGRGAMRAGSSPG